MRIWVVWLLAVALMAAALWVLLMFPLPGGSAATVEDIPGVLAAIGIIEMMKIVAVLLLPPIVMTSLEIRRARRMRDNPGHPDPGVRGYLKD
jgi:hypothetical protein